MVHGGPALPGLELVSIDNRAAARAIGTMAFAGATLPAILSQPHDSRAIATRPRQCLRPRRTRRKIQFLCDVVVDCSQSQQPRLTGQKVSYLLERLVPDSSRVFLDDVENDAFAAAVRPVAE